MVVPKRSQKMGKAPISCVKAIDQFMILFVDQWQVLSQSCRQCVTEVSARRPQSLLFVQHVFAMPARTCPGCGGILWSLQLTFGCCENGLRQTL